MKHPRLFNRLLRETTGRCLMLLLMALLCTPSALAYSFYALNEEGQKIYYNITDLELLTVEVTYEAAITYGDIYDIYVHLVIPSTVERNGVTYTVTGIGAHAFLRADIKYITLPNTITKIKEEAFNKCFNLTSLTIPENVTYIGRGVISTGDGGSYHPLNNIKTVYYNATNAEGDYSSSYGGNICGSITVGSDCEVIIGDNVEHIPDYFLCNSGITSINIPSGVTSIGKYAFSKCTGLTSVNIPSNVNSIGNYAFFNCAGLTTVTFPSTLNNIGSSAFNSCSRLSTVVAGMEVPPVIDNTVFPYRSQATLYVPKDCLANYVTANYWNGFKEIIEASRIYFADPRVEAICVANWDSNHDGYLDGLEAYLVTDLGDAFKNDTQIIQFNELSYFKGLTQISDDAFMGCSNLTTVTLPEQVTAIGNNAFQGCVSLPSIVLPTNINSIGNSAFEGCTSLFTITNLDKVSSIGECAFEGCSAITGISLNAAAVECNAFKNCINLNNISFGSKVTSLKQGAFMNCTSLEAVTIPGTIISIAGAFEGCTSLSSVSLNTGTKFIISGAFKNCSSLRTVILPSNLSQIGESAFEGTGLTDINIPSSVTSIQSRAFADCPDLETVTVNWTTPIGVPADAFPNRANQELYVPDGTKGLYRAADVWKDFKMIYYYFEPYALLSVDGKTLTFYYDNEKDMRPETTYFLNEAEQNPDWYSDGSYSNVTAVVFDSSFEAARPTSTANWFNGMSLLESISGIDNLNTSEVTIMAQMFAGCSSLEDIDLSHFNTAKLVNMSRMFWQCGSLTSLDLSNLNTSKVENMSWLFGYCNGLESIDMSGLNTSSVTTMMGMFINCSSLTELDLSSFNTQQVTNMGTMFTSCTSLQTIYVGDGWSTENLSNSSNMFYNCTSLVGSMGTTYNASHVDAAYAHIDGGSSNPGYFSEKPQFVRGDVNGDGQVRINDVTALIDYLLSGDDSNIIVGAADCNEDNQVRINDVTALIDFLLSGNW